MADLNKHVTWGGLQHYDSRIKAYVDDAVEKVQSNAADKSAVAALFEDVSQLKADASAAAVERKNLKEHIDEDEAAILVLQEDDKKINKEIADLRVLVENKVDHVTLKDYTTKEYVDASVKAIIAGTVDLTDYYKKDEVDTIIATQETTIKSLENTITDVSEEVSRVNIKTENLSSNLTNSIAAVREDMTKKADKSEIPTRTSQLINDTGFITQHQDISHLATKDELKDAIESIEHPTIDLSGYATKEDVAAVDARIPSIEGLATKQELEDAINSIEHPTVDLSNYVTKDEFDVVQQQSARNEVKLLQVDSELFDIKKDIEGIDVPTKVSELVNDSEFITTSAVQSLLQEKADNIPFEEDMRVSTPCGGFADDDSLQNMSIKEILVKLLGLSIYVPPVIPDEPTTLLEQLIAEKRVMYSIDNDGVLRPHEFNVLDGTQAPTESSFYTITDAEGKIIEGGYQDLSIENDSMYYIIALPKEVDFSTMLDFKTWDPYDSVWVVSNIELTCDPSDVTRLCEEVGVDTSHIDTEKYTVWACEEPCTGSIMRYTFKENL